ncbi:MAG: hypothetical protein QG608_2308 [Actinomycetota bacterium]|nr:hypothetical protein [Actinomycetota bacterium]
MGFRPGPGRPSDLTWLVTAGTVSSLGDGMTMVAAPMLATRLTNDPRQIALVQIASALPWLTVGIAAAGLSDRFPRRRLMVVADLIRTAILCGLALVAGSGITRLWPVYLLLFLTGTARIVFDSAAQALMVDVVEADELERGNGLLFAGQSTATALVGPACGAWFFTWSPWAPFAVDALTFTLSAVLLTRLRLHTCPGLPPGRRATMSVRDMVEGFRFVSATPMLRVMAILLCSTSLANGMTSGIMVLYVRDILHLPEIFYGLLISSEAAGMVVGGLLSGRIVGRFGTGRPLRIAIVWLSTSTLLLAACPVPALVFVLCATEGLALGIWGPISLSVRQRLVPHELLGRTMAVYRIVAQVALMAGTAAGGFLATFFTLRTPLVLGGLLGGLVVVPLARHLSDERLSLPGPSRPRLVGVDDHDGGVPPGRDALPPEQVIPKPPG